MIDDLIEIYKDSRSEADRMGLLNGLMDVIPELEAGGPNGFLGFASDLPYPHDHTPEGQADHRAVSVRKGDPNQRSNNYVWIVYNENGEEGKDSITPKHEKLIEALSEDIDGDVLLSYAGIVNEAMPQGPRS